MKVVLLFWLTAMAMPAHAQSLGRLFFTPEQRLLFDRQREHSDGAIDGATIRLDGSATRSNRKPAVWINGRVHDEPGLAKGLRVGESVDAVTGTRSDVVPHGSVSRTGAQ